MQVNQLKGMKCTMASGQGELGGELGWGQCLNLAPTAFWSRGECEVDADFPVNSANSWNGAPVFFSIVLIRVASLLSST